MPSIEEVIKNIAEYLKTVEEMKDPSINELSNKLGWSYLKTRTFTKALEEQGLITTEWLSGPPQRFIIRLTEKGKCLLNCFK